MSVVTILIDGVDETDSVLFDTAHFESQVNAVSGTCAIRVRDLANNKSFVGGAPLLLIVDGETVWRGFIATAVRTYVFPVVETDPGLGRYWDITGTDVNILLTRRIVFDQATPTTILAPLLPPHTADTTAITELLDDWLDLSGDGLDTTTFVENVGDTTWTQEGRAWMGSNTWAQAMQSIASLPAAIYYIDPDLNFVYTDVDTPNAAFALSDVPDGTTSKGYSSMEVLQDGSSLANDVFAWGIGYGSSVPVFVRDQDATSIATHGLWQFATTAFGVYLQSTIERIAASIIDGSPQSKRGAKNDRVAVMCTTFEPGLRVAQKVDFSSEVFGFTDVIPIRKMEIDFNGPDTPKYQLTLSHEIDTPLSLIDPFQLPGFVLDPPPPFPCPPPLVRAPNGQCVFPPIHSGPRCSNGCLVASCTCEDLNRTVAAPDWGGDWETLVATAAGGGIVPEVANVVDVTTWNVTRSTTLTQQEVATRELDLGACGYQAPPWDYYIAWKADQPFYSYEAYNDGFGLIPPGTYAFPGLLHEFDPGILTTIPQQFLQFWFLSDSNSSASPNNQTLLRIAMDATPSFYWSLGSIGLTQSFGLPLAFGFVINHTFKVHVRVEGNGIVSANLWDSDVEDEPDGWMIVRSSTHGTELTNLPYALGVSFVRGIAPGSLASDPDDNDFTFLPTQIDVVCGNFDANLGSDINTWVCESSLSTGTLITLQHPFLPNSPLVFVKGILQLQANYTQDPDAGTITLDFTPESGAAIRVCYWSLP